MMPDGTIVTVGSVTGTQVHGEDVAQALSPGGVMSQPRAWRRDGSTGELVFQVFRVCSVCQGKYGSELFPPGVPAKPNGPGAR